MTVDVRDQLQAAVASSYEIERELGGGGMSRVFVADEVAFGRQVVIKVLRPEIAESVSVERFRRETQLAARLQHPHIVPLFGGGEAAGLLYYTMPLVEGESLRARLQAEPQLAIGDALRLAREVADALAYAHSRGVVHRDIKPENILLSGGHALVTDFGIARALGPAGDERLTSFGIAVGTPAYMSPEQASGDADVDARSDVYSLGCVLYEMLTGTAPFTGPSVQAIIARRFTDQVPSVRAVRPSITTELDTVVAKAMATRPDERLASAVEFARALDQLAAHATLSPTRSAPVRSSRRGVSIGVAALAAVAVVAWLLTRVGTPPARRNAVEPGGSVAAGDSAAVPSIAVLTLKNASSDTLDAYLAEGITDEITSRLGRVGRLRVKSRGAVARVMSGGGGDYSDVGRRLGVDYLLVGSVRRSRDSLHALLQLVTANDETETWSRRYDVATAGLVALQDSIVQAVATAAAGQLGPGDRAALVRVTVVNPEAHDHYLRARFQLAKRTPVSVARAIEEFQAAGRIDPAMTNALAREGYAYGVFADWGWAHPAGLSSEQLLERGLAAADRALRQDSTNAEAWLARAYLLFLRHPRTVDGVIAAFERAVALDSMNAEAQYQYGQALMATGVTAKAVARYHRAIALEPDWASPLMSLGAVVSRSGDYEAGLRWLDSAIVVDPGSSYSFVARSTTRTAAGKAALAVEDATRAVRVSGGHQVPPNAAMAIALAATGDTATARQWADSAYRAVADTSHPAPTDAFYAAAAFVRTGQTARGLSVLERARPAGAWLWFYMTSPLFDGVRTSPRFVRLSERAKPPGA